ncbi:MAG: restriction endonuclease subunit S [Planctomycetota bacterium]|jgi:type I restriction enzyme S subunit
MADLAASAGWRTYRFDQMATIVNDRIDNPEEAGVDRYVGLEHLDSESLKLRRWGAPSDVTATKLLFRKGDIIFGRRRVYQRKLAVADFDGICSAHAMVLRAKPEVVLSEFLPFFMQSALFMERAKEISVGSLSPTINWKTLARQEFALPPLEEQRKIAVACEAAAQCADGLFELVGSLETLRRSLLDHHFSVSESRERYLLDDLAERIIDYRGKSPPKSQHGVPLITAKNIRDGFIDPEPREYIESDRFDAWMTRGLPAEGDVLFTTEAPLANVAVIPQYRFALGQRTVLLRANRSMITPRYLYWLIRSPAARREIFARASGTTALGIKQSLLRQVPLSIHSGDIQYEVCSQLDTVEALSFEAGERLRASQAVVRGLMEECLS